MTKILGIALVAAGLGLAGCSHESAPVDNGTGNVADANLSGGSDLNALDTGDVNALDANLSADNAAGDLGGNVEGNSAP